MTGKSCILPREVLRTVKIVVTTNHKKSAEVIVDGNIEGPNEIQFMSFTNCKTVPLNSLCLSKVT